ncbi:conserved hypothetical protein [Nitrosococcus halophilus Nc 4]|uniref:MAP3K TRAFs-binding domain-containing protein n=1 Tax=Nitrosococcus halophilus (strain Nc4) TaxID=472759 RepID=D5BWI5_NITHN|nr:TRAFs-binding domain-containing protein [Nitrosococcus halophilus]ADE15642.1 conserved hypothetical protein [Nitrosococcus halophilus Nc 4]
MPQKPLCFVLMPFGIKPAPTGQGAINFDRIYNQAIKSAIEDAGLAPLRADEEKTGGIIHKPMFERLLLCEYAVADLTTANANVFYELGVRHTARPCTTQALFAQQQPIPFDVHFLRALPYDLGPDNRFAEPEAQALRETLAERLQTLREQAIQPDTKDSPLFQLLGEWQPDLSRLKTDLFREQTAYNQALKERMAAARYQERSQGLAELRQLQQELAAHLDSQEVGVLVDLLLSYRALEGWNEMIALYEILPETLKHSILVREQLAFALNRRAGEAQRPEDRQRALAVLKEVEAQQGPSAETGGLMGRIYKDWWDETRHSHPRSARGYLKQAIAAYRRGFEADWRDAYPGINAVTLLDIRGEPEDKVQRDRLLPVVRFAVERRLEGKSPDYWDYATLLELAVLETDREAAGRHLDDALAAVRESWESKTTARNLDLIRQARAARGETMDWIEELIQALKDKVQGVSQ